ncbi:hypothetical protein V8G54_020265 [Vigna mungo]|uniref:Uncharacterized protein n=1 Tax=Vigna mungo TaxID=3915 RepID=A0AAQ3RW79_VIGMU
METLFLHPVGDDFPKLFVPLCLHESLIQLRTDHEELFCLLDAPLGEPIRGIHVSTGCDVVRVVMVMLMMLLLLLLLPVMVMVMEMTTLHEKLKTKTKTRKPEIQKSNIEEDEGVL